MKRAWQKLASPHYYYGRSIIRFTLHLIATQAGFFRRRGLDRTSKLELKRLKNSKVGKNALIIGGGPSIEKLNWAKVRNKIDEIFVTHIFHLTTTSELITPNFICLSDPNSFVSCSGKKLKIQKRLWNYINSTGAVVLVPFFYRHFNFPSNTKKIFFDDRELFTLNKNISPLKPRSYNSMTVLKALAFAVHLGYSKIYIIGLDNTEFIGYEGNKKNQIFLNYRKYFGKIKINLLASEKLNLDFFPDGLAGRFQSYAHLYGDLNKFKNKNIINLDSESLITNFIKKTSKL